MFYTIYITTNKVNNKKYIGKHATKNLDDDYLGSGIALKRAISKYGVQNFSKEILYVFDTEEEMNSKEIELITPEILLSEEYYNIASGGQGGAIVLKPGHPLYEQTKKKLSEAQQNRSQEMSNITTELHKTKKVGMYGKKQSEHQKKVVSELMKGKPKDPNAIRKQKESLSETFSDPNYIHPNKGKKKTPQEKEAMSVRSSNRPQKQCPHCNIVMDERNYARYHGDKCKKKVTHITETQ